MPNSCDRVRPSSRAIVEEPMGSSVAVETSTQLTLAGNAAWQTYVASFGARGLYCNSDWVAAICSAFAHRPYYLKAIRDGRLAGVLPLALVRSTLFGRYLVSLPYVNWAGVLANDESAATALVNRAVELADELDVKHLQLRHISEAPHPALRSTLTSKVQMRMPLPGTEAEAWAGVRSIVRTQVRKGEKNGLEIAWGTMDVLDDFYRVFATNMRDLGTPVFGKRLFREILNRLPGQAELCVVRLGLLPIAGALVVHGPDLTEVPSASALQKYRSTAANSLMYWRMIQRAIDRGQTVFDFGRSTPGGGTFEFKKKWGAQPHPTYWQYYVRSGSVADMRPEGGKFDRMIRLWQRMPVSISRILGPTIVRGIP